jgi:hypothetical protein
VGVGVREEFLVGRRFRDRDRISNNRIGIEFVESMLSGGCEGWNIIFLFFFFCFSYLCVCLPFVEESAATVLFNGWWWYTSGRVIIRGR